MSIFESTYNQPLAFKSFNGFSTVDIQNNFQREYFQGILTHQHSRFDYNKQKLFKIIEKKLCIFSVILRIFIN